MYKPSLGIHALPDSLVRRLGLQGVLFYGVEKNSTAQQARLQPTRQDRFGRILIGDVIIAINKDRIADTQDYYRALDRYDIGDSVTLTLLRGRQETELEVVLRATE